MASTVTENADYPGTVTVPDDTDALNAASVTAPGVGFQALADRTNNLASRTGGTTGVPGEFAYLDAAGAASSKSRTLRLGAEAFQAIRHPGETGVETYIPVTEAALHGATARTNAGGGGTRPEVEITGTAAATDQVIFDLSRHLPPGAVVTDVEALVRQATAQATAGDRMRLRGSRFSLDYSTPGAGPVTTDFDVNLPVAGPATDVIAATGLSVTIDPTEHFLAVVNGSAGAAPGANADDVLGLRVKHDGLRPGEDTGYGFSSNAGGGFRIRRGDLSIFRSGAVLNVNRFVPRGATINTVRVLINPGAARAVSSRMTLDLLENTTKDWITPALGTEVPVVAQVEDDGTAALQTIELTGVAYTVGTTPLALRVQGGEGDFAVDLAYGVEILFDDPGPRND